MLKSRHSVVFIVVILRLLPEIIVMPDVISGCACFVSIVIEIPLVILPVYVLRTYFYVFCYDYVLLNDQLSTFNTQQTVRLCFPGMMLLLAKSKQIIGCTLSGVFFAYHV